MSVDEIITLIDELANYIDYLYPGYITIFLYLFFKAKTLKDEKGVVVKSIVISFLYKLIIKEESCLSSIAYHSMLVGMSVFVAYIGYWLQTREEVLNFLEFFGIYTRFEEEAISLLDNEDISAWVKVYLKDENIVYEGSLGPRELEEGKRTFITLLSFRRYAVDENGLKKDKSEESYNTDDNKVLIYFDDIKRVEKISRKCNSDDNKKSTE